MDLNTSNSRKQHFRAHSGLVRVGLFCMAAAIVEAQTVEVPRPAAGQTLQGPQYQSFDATHLKDRPYGGGLPKPQYPSTDRIEREYVVEYVYDYAYSQYTPEVKMPVIPAATAKRDTPENALIAVVSAMRTGDYQAFVKCWDDADQKQLAADAKEKKQDGSFWQGMWRRVFTTGRDTLLTGRIETQSYVLLDFHLSAPSTIHATMVFKNVNGQWLATNELSNNPILFPFQPNMAGLIQRVPPIPVAKMSPEAPQIRESQQQFLDQHTQRDRTVQAGR